MDSIYIAIILDSSLQGLNGCLIWEYMRSEIFHSSRNSPRERKKIYLKQVIQ